MRGLRLALLGGEAISQETVGSLSCAGLTVTLFSESATERFTIIRMEKTVELHSITRGVDARTGSGAEMREVNVGQVKVLIAEARVSCMDRHIVTRCGQEG